MEDDEEEIRKICGTIRRLFVSCCITLVGARLHYTEGKRRSGFDCIWSQKATTEVRVLINATDALKLSAVQDIDAAMVTTGAKEDAGQSSLFAFSCRRVRQYQRVQSIRNKTAWFSALYSIQQI